LQYLRSHLYVIIPADVRDGRSRRRSRRQGHRPPTQENRSLGRLAVDGHDVIHFKRFSEIFGRRPALCLTAADKLDIYFIDVEAGNATLLVSRRGVEEGSCPAVQ
jgi:hypothetical protein